MASPTSGARLKEKKLRQARDRHHIKMASTIARNKLDNFSNKVQESPRRFTTLKDKSQTSSTKRHVKIVNSPTIKRVRAEKMKLSDEKRKLKNMSSPNKKRARAEMMKKSDEK